MRWLPKVAGAAGYAVGRVLGFLLDRRERWIVSGWRRWAGWSLMLAGLVVGWATVDTVGTLVSLSLAVAGFGLIDAHERLAEQPIRLVKVRHRGRTWTTVKIGGRRR